MRCVVDGPRLEAFKERLPKKQTTLHRRNATRNVLDITLLPTLSDLIERWKWESPP